jgi:cytochrome b561
LITDRHDRLIFILHAGAALYHHHIQRDPTLRRMLPWPA